MNIKIVLPLVLVCVFSFCCAPKPEPQGPMNIKITGDVDPNTLAIVTLKLVGETLPGTPKVVSAEDTSAALFDRMGSPEYVMQVGADKWAAILTPGESYVIGWIVEDKKLFGYCSEPFVAEKDSEVTFSPGMPLSLEYDLTETEEGVTVFPAVFFLSRKAIQNGSVHLMPWGVDEVIEEPKVIKIDGLAEGTYQLFARALNTEECVKTRTRFLNDERYVEISSTEANRYKARFPLLDTTIEDGDITIRGQVHNTAGEILPGEQLILIPYNEKDITQRYDLYYPNIVSDSNGFFTFKGVRPGISAVIQGSGASIDLRKNVMTKDATLWVDFLFRVLNMRLYTGYSLPEFDIDWKDGRISSMNTDMYGKTAVVDVWTSWCEPCQKSLAEFNALAQEYKDNEDVVFVAMSVEASRADWENAVNKSGLSSIRHCWYDLKNPVAFNRPIPYFMIIDKKGILRAQGDNLDIRDELKKVLEASE